MTISNCIGLGVAYLLAAMMPGPSITLIIRNGILHSRSASIRACLGTVVGTALQSGAILTGLTFIENHSLFFKGLKILCSIYLIYLGTKILLFKKLDTPKNTATQTNIITKNKKSYFLEGFLVEFLNPLAFTFFISITSIVLESQNLWSIKFLYWLEIVILGFIWFFTVALVISSEMITFYTRKFNKTLETLAGCIFILFGSKMFIH